MDLRGGQCLVDSLTGAVASERVTEAFKGYLSTDGNRAKSANAEGSLTARQTGRAVTKVGVSDPAVESGIAVAQRIKATLGITGFGCSPIKAVRELGSERRETVRSLSITGVGNLRRAVLSTRGPGWTYRWCICCSAKGIAG